jgi:hypothetical protein
LSINSIFGTVEDFGASSSQLLGQRVNPYHPKVDIRRTCFRSGPNFGLIAAAEKHLNLVTPHDCKHRRRLGRKANPLSIPVTGDLETKNLPVLLGRPHQVRNGELGHR